ncbi:MAG: DNA replication/repair protein RecF [Rhodospirillaceae bacterium]|jgi:DNA replication and repair protein RecF|nr:DNA replication/repair protein RecF [Rhodospirillaceae bacterium]MBT4588331.1 DNA replication/repair protein RecF [Rhodospirillaceae bacterium]MBT5939810.1 DNA replication/repair protein RecF [Rhodospirillaceae bacterium]MBT7266036.1 DNA replication/repair protein RecF [Rhodospirillaceae bacterium]
MIGSPDQLAVSRLTLTNFRNYAQGRLEVDGRPVVLTGANGVGKTNLLEALSFLVPGRGLRRAKLSEIGRRSASTDAFGAEWAVAAKLRVGENDMEIGTGIEVSETPNGRDKRVIKIDGTVMKSQAELGRYTSAQWLAPQMDRLFLEGASGRRRFVDQLIYGLDPEHAGPVAAYDHSVRSRNKLLRDGKLDPEWLNSIEESIARHGVAIAVRRLEAVGRLQEVCRTTTGAFPGAVISMAGQIEDWLADEAALAVEDRLRAALAASRPRDAESGSTSIGPHRSDFAVRHGETNMEAEICSTGEQKALLIGIVLATARLQTEERGHTPLLLLDEIAAHLDEDRRASLFELILDMGAQAWITGTEDEIFAPLGETVQHFAVKDGEIAQI